MAKPYIELVYETPLFVWDKGPPPHNDLTAKVYGGIHTLHPSGFELVTSKEETHVLAIRPTQVVGTDLLILVLYIDDLFFTRCREAHCRVEIRYGS
jgi:hypothetical protein